MKKRKSGKLPPFVALTWNLLNSKAYKELSPSASKLLPFFLGKPKINQAYPACYEIEFEFTYSEARKYGFCNKTFSRCIRELMSKGFIDPVWKGGLRGDRKSSSKFRVSRRWEDYGNGNFKQINWEQFITPNVV